MNKQLKVIGFFVLSVFSVRGQATVNSSSSSGSNASVSLNWRVGRIYVGNQLTYNKKSELLNSKDDQNLRESILVENIQIFPNPTNGFVTIKSGETTSLKLLNSAGKLIQESISNGQYELDLTQYEGTLFFIKLNDETFKIVKY